MQAANVTQPEVPAFGRWLQEIVKMNPAKFDGSADAMSWTYWLVELEKMFEGIHCPEDCKVAIAQCLSIKDASDWWRRSELD